jgi:uncharacterized membrane protein YphA (DoxX/SURF4 family)
MPPAILGNFSSRDNKEEAPGLPILVEPCRTRTFLTLVAGLTIVLFCHFFDVEETDILEYSSLVNMIEALLRVIFGWRFLISGLSNIRRWPNAVGTASLLFPKGATFFGFMATVLMVAGGIGVALGFQTPVCALMLAVFLIPTFNLHSYWLKVLPTMVPVVKNAMADEKAQSYFRSFDRQAYHAHEVGIHDNLVFLAAALYFAVRGSGAFGIDNWLSEWVVRLF